MYKFTNFPFFSVPDNLTFKKNYVDDVVTVYMAIDNNCWYSPSPCPYSPSLRAKKKFGFIIFYNENTN